MISASFKIVIPEDSLHQAKEILGSLSGPFEIEPGCISCKWFCEVENPRTFLWVEEWKSLTDLENHIQSNEFKKLLFVLDMSESEPEIRIKNTIYDDGMEYIKKLFAGNTGPRALGSLADENALLK